MGSVGKRKKNEREKEICRAKTHSVSRSHGSSCVCWEKVKLIDVEQILSVLDPIRLFSLISQHIYELLKAFCSGNILIVV